MTLRQTLAIALLAASTSALADTVDINLSDKSAQMRYSMPLGRDSLGKSEFNAGFLYTEGGKGMIDAGMQVMNEVGTNLPGLTVGLGFKGLAASVAKYDAAALALGGQVRFSPSIAKRLGLVGQFYFAPKIVTFGDANRYVETGLRLEYEILPQATAYVGYRKIRFGIDNNPGATLDEGANVGIKFLF